jgi:hypothetical protein
MPLLGLLCSFVVVVALSAGPAHAQDAGVEASEEAVDPNAAALQRAIDGDPFAGSDPLGDAQDPLSTGDRASLDEVRPDPDVEEVEAPVPVRHGAILEAIAGVRETEHQLDVVLEGGLAIATETMHFSSSARHDAEVQMRLAVPDGAVLVSLHVENAVGARDGTPDDAHAPQGAYDDALLVRSSTPSALPVAHARIIRSPGGTVIVARAAPVRGAAPSAEGSSLTPGELTLVVRWAVPMPLHAGVARLPMPTRGTDERAAPSDVSVTAVDLVEPRIDGVTFEREAVVVSTASPFVVTGLAPISRGPHVEASLVPCGARRCARLRAVGARAHVSDGDVIVAIDASPSTSAGARGRITDTVRVLVSLLPRTSRVRVVAFAARTEALSLGAPSELDLSRVRLATESQLGSATRFEALWSSIENDVHAGTRIVIVGDGGLTNGDASRAAFAAAAARGAILSAIDVADRGVTRVLSDAVLASGGSVVEAGAAADVATRGHGDEALAELLTRAVSDRVPGALAAHVDGRVIELGRLSTGEEIVWQGPASRADVALGSERSTARAPDAAHLAVSLALAAHVESLVAVDARDLDSAAGACGVDGVVRARAAVRASSIVGHGVRVAPAHRRSCAAVVAAATTEARATSLPARVLRDMLRRRVIPAARGCFRDDRAGRPRHHRAVEFQVTLADREIVDASVGGDIPEELASCLLRAFDGVEVPQFAGTLIVRWPVHTDAVLPPPVIELGPDVARMVDDVGIDETPTP